MMQSLTFLGSSSFFILAMEDQRIRRESFDKGPCWVKMLISDKVAGGVIGKAGVVVNQLQEMTHTHVKVAPNKNYFPSTQERALIISGQLSSIKKCMGLVIAKAVMCDLDQDSSEPLVVDPSEIELRGDILARLVVPNSAVSGIIGKAGEVIREIGKESGAYLRISDRFPGLQERTVTVTGKIFEVINAAENVITRIQDDRNLRDHLNVVYQEGIAARAQGRFISPEAPLPVDAVRSHSASSDASMLTAATPVSMQQLFVVPLSVTMDIPESISAFVTGQEGCHLRQIACQTASHLIATPKPGVLTVTISGPMQSVQAAHMLLVRRVIDAQTLPEAEFSGDESDEHQSVYKGGVPPTPQVAHVQPPASTEAASLDSPKYAQPTWDQQPVQSSPVPQMVSTMPYMQIPSVPVQMGSPSVAPNQAMQGGQFPSFPMMMPPSGMGYPYQFMPVYGPVVAQS